MAARKDTIFERFISPLLRPFLDEEGMRQFRHSVDWESEGDRFRSPQIDYPSYYSSQNFHGIERGYLNPDAAVTYDPITQYALPPNETWVRQSAIDAISCKPRRILDLGCGTGSTTVMLKQAFPNAEVIGLDLSPYMLFVAERKAQAAGLNIQWCHANAERTGFPDASFDLVTASLLFHETPPGTSKSILRECFRLLQAGGEVLILDGNQKTLRVAQWLTDIFEEPYLKDYAAGSVDAWMGAAGFEEIKTEDVWWVNQVTRGVKPLPVGSTVSRSAIEEDNMTGFAAPAFS
ncbi:MAG: class I SAM-dependent methyltransferase [Cyanosarcina radialis HA8281-LM2]|jgi:ubiquinone/menaquinone biosynthesis C-methylase UbiE|nr:class I SAM-dependent methyltransferase [Cyanosarcina radialis HA8281-LM2]